MTLEGVWHWHCHPIFISAFIHDIFTLTKERKEQEEEEGATIKSPSLYTAANLPKTNFLI